MSTMTHTTRRSPGRNAAASLFCLSALASSTLGQPADSDISPGLAEALGLIVDQDEQDVDIDDLLAPGEQLPDPIFARRSRTWDQIMNPANIERPDPHQLTDSRVRMEIDPFRFTEEPSSAPSAHPSAIPTATPSALPSASPSMPPTPSPTNFPTVTAMPTTNMWDTEPEPTNPRGSYFNYNPYGSRGPDRWVNVEDPPEAKYWEQFEDFIDPSLNRNRCDNDRQSPIDVRFDRAEGQCFEYHEIRHTDGEYSVMNPKVDAEILPSKLRIVYPVEFDEDCNADWTETEWDPEVQKVVCKDNIKGPSADIPKGWGYQLPVTHVDIKIPSEHYMEGKQYAAEYQINLIQNKSAKRGAPVISVFFDLHPQNVPNKALQIVLDRFQMEYDADLAKCEANRRKQRRLEAILAAGEDQGTWLDEPEEEEVKFQSHLRKTQRDLEQTYTYFDPWDGEIMRSIWFFGYEGSLTEPPCTEFVEWRIIDTPALISIEQLHQMKKILFHHVDGNCERTSVHYEGSVARPLQSLNRRLVHRCMCRDFIADRDRKRYGANRCTWRDRGDIFGFDEDVFTSEWYDEHHKYENMDHQNCEVFNTDCDKWAEELAKIEAEKWAAENPPTPSPRPWWST